MKHIITTLTAITLAACGAPSDEDVLVSSLPGFDEYLAMAEALGEPLPFHKADRDVIVDPEWTGLVEKDGIDFLPLYHGASKAGTGETPDGDCKGPETPCYVPKNRSWVIGRCLDSIGQATSYPGTSYVAAIWNGIDMFAAYVNGLPGGDAWNVSIADTCNGQYSVRPVGFSIPGVLGETTYAAQDSNGSARRWAWFDTKVSVPQVIAQAIRFGGGDATIAQINNMLRLVTLHELMHSAGLSHDNGRYLMRFGGSRTLMTYQTNVSGMVGYKAEQRIRQYRP
jgi:hypothetical protein